MKDKLEQRLTELQSEFESGQKMLSDLESQQAELQRTLLRISGAIQVIRELLGDENENGVEDAEHLLQTETEVAPK